MANHYVHFDEGLHDDDIVRRHLDLAKYLDLLRSSEMYFRRADKFADKYEGKMPAGMRQAMLDSTGGMAIHPDEWDRRTKAGNYLNCWNLSAQDNMALWQLYGGAANSVVITSTVGKLIKTALRWDRDMYLHKVKYINHFKPSDMIVGTWSDLLRYKHVAYKFEEELRFVIPQQGDGWESNPEDLRLPVDLNELIRTVVVAPESKDWFYDMVKDVTEKYGVTREVHRSMLSFMSSS